MFWTRRYREDHEASLKRGKVFRFLAYVLHDTQCKARLLNLVISIVEKGYILHIYPSYVVSNKDPFTPAAKQYARGWSWRGYRGPFKSLPVMAIIYCGQMWVAGILARHHISLILQYPGEDWIVNSLFHPRHTSQSYAEQRRTSNEKRERNGSQHGWLALSYEIPSR